MDVIAPETISSINREDSKRSDDILKAGISGLMNAKVVLLVILLIVVVYWFWFRQPFTTHPVVLNPQSTYVLKN